MALFSKLSVKKYGRSRASAGAGHEPPATSESTWRPAKTGTGGITITGFGLVEQSPTRRIIQVTHGNAGMCAVLENAVLLFASGHAEPARTLLAEGIESDKDARASPLAWLALFDLVQRAADRSTFEQLALQYVVQFEHSAPTWDDRVRPKSGPRPTHGPRPTPGGYVSVTGKLTAASATQLESLRQAIAKNASQARFDLAGIAEFDDAGARLLADVLGEARLRRYPLRLQRPEKLNPALEAAVKRGRAGGEGAWLLSLEFLQWQNDRAAFDDRAVDYAVTFEVSPPSWHPPEIAQATAAQGPDTGAAATAAGKTVADDLGTTAEELAWTGVVTGSHSEQVARLTAFAEGREVVPVDMTQVERIDFVGAADVYNAIKAIEDRQKAVKIFGATPIIRAILLLIGVSSGHFFTKAQ